MIDHEHMLISIPPKMSVSNLVGYIKVAVQFILLVTSEAKRRISLEKAFGLEDIL